MNTLSPYLRVLAGFFAAVCTWLIVVSAIQVDFGQVVTMTVFAAGLWYLALAKPIRDHIARVKARNAAIVARADAANAAFMAGDTAAALAAPPPVYAPPPVRKGVVAAAIVAAGLTVIGIATDISDGFDESEDQSPPSSTQPVPTSAARATTSASPTTTVAPSATITPTTIAPATSVPAAAPVPQSASAPTALMPAVLCMNLQAAQDAIQAAGVFYSRSEDATGKGRMQISDRNWVVVAQSPAPGIAIDEGDAVLSVVKYGESGDCP
ncbi:hypothetical protein [Aldersonia kunmingensis]|uniref:hypothetical protein n=1 Tax=Aldersonia kunmingensis TaxID=408066 RepID=UPI000834B0AA|nr:hypothetical protein [Aldersonia kunmingensis]